MAELTVRVPEINTPRVSPGVGTNITGFGAAFRNITSGLSNLADLATARNEREQSVSFAQATLDQLDLGLQATQDAIGVAPPPKETFVALAEDGTPLTDRDVGTLQDTAKQQGQLAARTLQQPRRARFDLERAVLLKKQIANNPLIAPELLKMSTTAGGRTVGEGFAATIDDAEARRKAYVEHVNTQAPLNGLPPNVAFDDAAFAVAQKDSLSARAEMANDNMALINVEEEGARVKTLNYMRGDVIPDAVMKVSGSLRALFLDPGTGIIREDLTRDQQATLIRQGEQLLNGVRAQLGLQGGSATSGEDITTSMLPLTAIFDSFVAAVKGDIEYGLLEKDLKVAEMAAMDRIFSSSPGLQDVKALHTILMKDMPDAYVDNLFTMFRLNKLGYNPMMHAMTALDERLNFHSMIKDAGVRDLPALKKAFENQGKHLIEAASSEDVTDEQFGKMLGASFAEYNANPNNPDLAATFHEMLPAISHPDVIKRMKQTGVSTQIRIGSEMYIDDVINGLIEDINVTGAETTEFKPIDTPSRMGGRVRFKSSPVSEHFSTDIAENGAVTFILEPDASADSKRAVADLNKFGSRLGMISTTISELGVLAGTPQEISNRILQERRLPQTMAIPDRDVVTPVSLEIVGGTDTQAGPDITDILDDLAF